MVPIKPGKFADGRTIQYNHPRMDPLWAAIESRGLPLAFHIGEAIPTAEPGAVGVSVLTQMQGFRQNWAQLTFGGVFDRFPGLRVVFVEAGLCLDPRHAPRRRHDLQFLPHHGLAEARPPAELVLAQRTATRPS